MQRVGNDCVSVFQVTVFQVVRNPGRPDQFTFTIDSSLINVTIYITGFLPLTFNLTDPSGGVSLRSRSLSQHVSIDHMLVWFAGVTQNSSQSSGPLASISAAGNLRRLRIHPGGQTGSWKIQVDSVNSYSVKVTGQWQRASGALFSSGSAHVQVRASRLFAAVPLPSFCHFCG